MQFCDEYCAAGPEVCPNKGIYPLNPNGYHRVCESHTSYFKETLGKCGYCESLFITNIPLNSSEPNQSFQENIEVLPDQSSLLENPIQDPLHFQEKCPNCSKISLIIQLKCSHLGCLSCENEGKCILCEKNKKNCINCSNTAQNYAVFRCGHEACIDCIVSFCKKCEDKGNPQKCSRCNLRKNICLAVDFGNEGKKCEHISCFGCISMGKRCLVCLDNTGNFIENKIIESSSKSEEKKKTDCPNCSSFSFLLELKCRHIGCESCKSEIKCKYCKKNEKICINCNGIAQNMAYFECRHFACVDCINEYCKKCNSQIKQICKRCNINKYLCLKTPSKIDDNCCQHPSCFECICRGINCNICNDNYDGSKCPNCGRNGILIEAECKHLVCQNCVDYGCAKCWQGQQGCINCQDYYQEEYSFDCGHLPCKNCLKGYCKLCNKTQEKNLCIHCKKSKIILQSSSNNSVKKHPSCYSCIQLNKHKIEEKKGSKIKKNEEKFPNHCDKCKKKKDCKKLNCGHNICNPCLKNKTVYCPLECRFYTCNSCRIQKICFPCESGSEYICLNCSESHQCTCMNCGDLNSKPLNCKHRYCSNCSEVFENVCIYCMEKDSICFICLSENYEKTLLECGHIACEACNRDKLSECFDCLFSKNEIKLEITTESASCFWCGNKSCEYLTLACDHKVCINCIYYDYKIYSYSCCYCPNRTWKKICYLCLGVQKIKVNDNETLTLCCNKHIPYY